LSAFIARGVLGSPIIVEREADEWLSLVNDLNTSNDQFQRLLSDVEPEVFDIALQTTYKPEETLLSPLDLRTLGPETLAEVKQRMRDENLVGHFLRARNTLAVVRATVGGEFFRNNWAIKRLRHYIDMHEGNEPFVEASNGMADNVYMDSMSPVRIHLLQQAALSEFEGDLATRVIPGGTLLLSEVYREIAEYIFIDPWVNTLKFKSITALFKQMTCALSPIGAGEVINWSGNLSDPLEHFTVAAVDGNDAATYQYVRSSLSEDKDALLAAGLINTAKWYVSLITASPGPEVMRQISECSFIETVAGFLRGNRELSHLAQIAKIPERPKGDAPFGKIMRELWRDQIHRIKDRIPSYSDYTESILSSMTTRSSGGYKISWDAEINGKPVRMSSTDKILNFLSRPNYFLDPETTKNELTEENPASIFTRDVVSRSSRGIFAMPLGHFTAEAALAPQIISDMGKDPDYSIFKGVGKTLADHAPGIRSSARGDTLNVLMDFSQFDASQGFSNVRSNVLAGIEQALFELGINEPWGPWDSLFGMHQTIWERMAEAHFVTGNSAVTTDSLTSGEYYTIIINNITNKSNFLNILQKMPDWSDKKMRLAKLLIMGDDSAQIWNVMGALTTAEIAEFVEVIVEVTGSNGMSINKYKTSVRRFFYEYLKKRGEYGYSIPRKHQIQVLSSEKVNQEMLATEQLAAYAGRLSEWVSRGGNPTVALRLYLFTAILRRRVKSRSEGGDVAFTNLPLSTMYGPVGLHGTGQLPWSLAGANKDVMCYLAVDGFSQQGLNYAAHLSDSPGERISASIAAQAAESEVFAEGVKFAKDQLNTARLVSSERANAILDKAGFSLGRLAYKATPERMIDGVVKDNPATKSIAFEQKRRNAFNIEERGVALPPPGKSSDILNLVVGSLGRVFELTRSGLRDNIAWCDSLAFEGVCSRLECDPELISKWMGESVATCQRVGRTPVLVSISPVAGTTTKYVRFTDELPYESDITVDHTWDVPARQRVIERIVPGASTTPVKNYMIEKFSWLTGVVLLPGEEVAEVIPINPVAGLHPTMARMVRQIGVSSAGDEVALKVNRILGDVTDNKFPRDIRPETIFNVLTTSGIGTDLEMVANILMGMGAEPARAMKAASRIIVELNNFNFLDATKGYSTEDQIIGHLNLTRARYQELIAFENIIAEPTFSDAIRNIAMLRLLTDDYRQPRRHYTIRLMGSNIDRMLEKIGSRSFSNVTRFQTIYSSTFFTD
jgi:hypothetical protein